MKISLRTDVITSGAHEGLLISTGFFTTEKAAASISPIGSPSHFLPSFCGNSPAAGLLVPQLSSHFQNADFNLEAAVEQWHNHQQSQQNAKTIENDQMEEMDADIQQQQGKSSEIPPLTEMGQLMQTNGEEAIIMPETAKTIKLNLFGEPTSKDKCTAELVPSMDTFKNNPRQKCQNQPNSPLLCDTTTTRTTVEVFRAKPDNAHFFQIPKGPLSTAKQNVELIPVEGPDYERMDRSETQFSDRINSPRNDLAPPKSLQWDENWPVDPLSPSFCQKEFPFASFAPFSPPRQSSTPLHFDSANSQQFATANGNTQMGPIVNSSSPRQFADGLTTVLRQQRCDKSERFLRQRKIDSANEEKEAKIPPRPPKTVPFWENRMAPPRPPKPAKYLRKSQSVGFVNQNFTEENAIRTAASNNTLKLYQTRDCLGRIVCEW